ncbi:hypothetical protein SDC9_154831 [bioreactor metagenome]|uniref:Uncharacterized protein n=1 Tax=bioreactor metagenome TaxID=1076179 RepID=A0A645F1D0_9ZZZZ
MLGVGRLGSRHPMGLVARHQVNPPRRTPIVVTAADHRGGLILIDQPGQHVEHAVQSVDRAPLLIPESGRNTVVRAEVQRRSIHDEAERVSHPPMVPP